MHLDAKAPDAEPTLIRKAIEASPFEVHELALVAFVSKDACLALQVEAPALAELFAVSGLLHLA